jgi:hypothetical protein
MEHAGRLVQILLVRCAYAYSNTHPYAYAYTHADSYANTDTNSNAHPDTYAYTHTYARCTDCAVGD